VIFRQVLHADLCWHSTVGCRDSGIGDREAGGRWIPANYCGDDNAETAEMTVRQWTVGSVDSRQGLRE
jgi:hypothetical protein